jgi:hypothetical protein
MSGSLSPEFVDNCRRLFNYMDVQLAKDLYPEFKNAGFDLPPLDEWLAAMKAKADAGLDLAFRFPGEEEFLTHRPSPEDLDGLIIGLPPFKTVFRVQLADGTVLEFPLLSSEPMGERMVRFQGLFEELWAVPGVREVFEKYEVVVKKAGE